MYTWHSCVMPACYTEDQYSTHLSNVSTPKANPVRKEISIQLICAVSLQVNGMISLHLKACKLSPYVDSYVQPCISIVFNIVNKVTFYLDQPSTATTPCA